MAAGFYLASNHMYCRCECVPPCSTAEKGLVKLPLRVDCADVGMDAESVCGHGLSLHALRVVISETSIIYT